jgi:hypothetical protein
MAAFLMPRALYGSLGYNLDRAIEVYAAALDEHRTTVDVPAPSPPSPLVEVIVRNHDGAYQIIDDAAGRGPTLKATFT